MIQLMFEIFTATQIRNIDGKAIGKDGKVLLPVRRIQVCTEPGGVSSNQSSGWEDHTVQAMKTTSFASALHAENKTPKVNFRTLFNEENVEDADFVLPKENVEMAHARFANSLVGFFVGKRVAFPLVQNYVNNTWSKLGFQSVIKDDDDVYFGTPTRPRIHISLFPYEPQAPSNPLKAF
uniref:Uncharacterized protein n=1 Tax=Tanacetum cinerariifolium TaxID=118510 RepID=A0A6L2LKM4_TANCI|nr:hypothetical protein [Tanacetum cinerariifolium]